MKLSKYNYKIMVILLIREQVYTKDIPAPWSPYIKSLWDTQWYTCKPETESPFEKLTKEQKNLFQKL